MTTLLILTYVAVLFLLLRLVRLPARPGVLVPAVLIGGLGLGLLLLALDYSHPHSGRLRVETAAADATAGLTLSATFPQKVLQRLRAGEEAEVALRAVPGRVFRAKVREVPDRLETADPSQPGGNAPARHRPPW